MHKQNIRTRVRRSSARLPGLPGSKPPREMSAEQLRQENEMWAGIADYFACGGASPLSVIKGKLRLEKEGR